MRLEEILKNIGEVRKDLKRKDYFSYFIENKVEREGKFDDRKIWIEDRINLVEIMIILFSKW